MPGQDTTAIVDALWEGTGTPASLITEITSLDGTVSYSYDSAGQLLGATYTAGQAAEAYSYDAAGNRITANGAAYITGPNNQLLFDGIYSYLYDPEGNRTARFIDVNANGLLDAGDTAATTYAWDHRNRLTRVTDYATYGDPATRAIDYLYDTENRWIGRDVDSDGDGQIDTRTRFIYDGNQIVLQFDRAIAPSDDSADPLTLENLSHRYLWNPAAVDQLMADEHVTTPDSPGSILWPLADHLGTIRDLAAYDSSTDAATIVNHRTFDAYGNLQSQTNATSAHDTLFAFTGRPLDQTTGLQNNLHRWYDAATGRWMSEDPIGFEGKDANLTRYVRNNPPNIVDPIGLWGKDVHIWMTFRLTGLAGMERVAGYTVARAANFPDEGRREPISATAKYIGGVISDEEMQERAQWHFPTSPDGHVYPGSDAARRRYKMAIDPEQTKELTEQQRLVMFGEGLHVLQDSYSHQGVPVYAGVGHSRGSKYIPGLGERRLKRGPATVVSGSSDSVEKYWQDARDAGMATYLALLELRKAMPHLFPKEAASLKDVADWLERWYPDTGRTAVR